MSMSPAQVPEVEVRLYGDLGWFCPDVDGRGTVALPVGAPRSIADLLESLGVPPVEVGAVLADGESAGLDDLVPPGTRVAVYPPARDLPPPSQLWPEPPEPRRFVADVHLGVLARRLQQLGFDTWYADDADDATLVARAVDDERILLSRDRRLLMDRAVVHGYCLRSVDPDEQLDEVVTRYGLARRTRPHVAPRDRGVGPPGRGYR